MEEIVKQRHEAIRDVEVQVEALADDSIEGDLDQAIGPGGADGASGNSAIKEALLVINAVEEERELHVGDAVDGGDVAVVEVAELVEEGGVDMGIEIEVVGANKGDEVLERVVIEGGEVEEATGERDMKRVSQEKSGLASQRAQKMIIRDLRATTQLLVREERV